MSQMLKSSSAMGAATVVSRLLGLCREIVYAAFMGTSHVAGAFLVAFMVPNLFRRLLGEGALTAAFIPIFKEKERSLGDAEMWRSANAVICGLTVAALAITGVVLLALTLVLSSGLASGYTRLLLELLRIMFPYMYLVCLAATFMAMLNARGHFFIPSLGAALLNVVMIASILWLAPRMGTTLDQQVYGLAVGVLVAGFVQAAFQVPALRREGFRFAWVTPWHDPTVREVIRKMLPASVGVAAFQINVLLTQAVAFAVDAPIVAAFNYAVRLMEFPQGVFGISLATYLLPTLAGLASAKDYDAFRATVRQGLDYLLFANLLASVFLVVLSEPMVRLLFERRMFGTGSTLEVSTALGCLAPGLIAFSSVNILARAFYALGDTNTPMRISVFCLGVNLLFTVLLIMPFGAAGVGLANTATSFLNLALLGYGLRRKLGHLGLRQLKSSLTGLLPASAVAAIVALLMSRLWESQVGHETLPAKLGAVFGPMLAAALCYLGVAYWTGVPAVRELMGLFGHRRA
jgi:putative peptidoglycan lipid II flippase